MAERILFVDDDPNILSSYRRTLRNKFELETAEGGKEGLQVIKEKGPFAVVVSDMQMPNMNGVEFLMEVAKLSSETVRMMLTGNADQKTAVDAVNRGHIYRFINKPCPPEVFAEVLGSGIQQYRLITAEKELLDKTLKGSIGAMTEVLSLVNPTAFSKAARIKRYVSHVAREMKLDNTWQYEVASMLSMIGCVSLPSDTLESIYSGEEPTPGAQELFNKHPKVGKKLLSSIPRLENVAMMVGQQLKPFSRLSVATDDPAAQTAVLGAQMIHAANEYDLRICGKQSHHEILKELRGKTGEFDPKILDALESFKDDREQQEKRSVLVSELNVFMTVDDDVKAKNGALLVARGQQVTYSLLQRLKNFQYGVGVEEPIQVLVENNPETCEAEGIDAESTLEKPVTT